MAKRNASSKTRSSRMQSGGLLARLKQNHKGKNSRRDQWDEGQGDDDREEIERQEREEEQAKQEAERQQKEAEQDIAEAAMRANEFVDAHNGQADQQIAREQAARSGGTPRQGAREQAARSGGTPRQGLDQQAARQALEATMAAKAQRAREKAAHSNAVQQLDRQLRDPNLEGDVTEMVARQIAASNKAHGAEARGAKTQMGGASGDRNYQIEVPPSMKVRDDPFGAPIKVASSDMNAWPSVDGQNSSNFPPKQTQPSENLTPEEAKRASDYIIAKRNGKINAQNSGMWDEYLARGGQGPSIAALERDKRQNSDVSTIDKNQKFSEPMTAEDRARLEAAKQELKSYVQVALHLNPQERDATAKDVEQIANLEDVYAISQKMTEIRQKWDQNPVAPKQRSNGAKHKSRNRDSLEIAALINAKATATNYAHQGRTIADIVNSNRNFTPEQKQKAIDEIGKLPSISQKNAALAILDARNNARPTDLSRYAVDESQYLHLTNAEMDELLAKKYKSWHAEQQAKAQKMGDADTSPTMDQFTVEGMRYGAYMDSIDRDIENIHATNVKNEYHDQYAQEQAENLRRARAELGVNPGETWQDYHARKVRENKVSGTNPVDKRRNARVPGKVDAMIRDVKARYGLTDNEYLKTSGVAGLDGAAFGFGEHAMAGYNTLFGSGNFKDNRYRAEALQDRLRDKNPILYGASEMVGTVANNALVGASLPKLGLSAAANLSKNAGLLKQAPAHAVDAVTSAALTEAINTLANPHRSGADVAKSYGKSAVPGFGQNLLQHYGPGIFRQATRIY